ncbi:xanthine/uracil/vitamin C permease [Pavlovales sp. CCMP2436]|nr:xanthine/uracil/vitamin C permease [Pavlovales sp. CCMP2436]
MGVIGAWLDVHFKVTERGSTLSGEIRAGTVTFMTMAYILLVNPTILAGAGMPFRSVASATALSAIIGCSIVGLVANLPFGLSSGMGLNAYFAFGVCVATSMTYDVALTCCLVQGVLFALLTVCGASEFIQHIMPHNLKHAITVGIGLFQAFIGFRMTGLVVPNEETLVALGNVANPYVLLGVATTLLIAVLTVQRVQGAMLIGVVTSSCISWVFGLHPLPESVFAAPTLEGTFCHFNFTEYLARWHETVPITLAFLFVALFDTAGVQFGAGLQAGLVDPITHKLPGSTYAFLASAFATMAGSVLGTSPVIIANESCAGIADGGRTGLTAIVIACWFAVSVFFIPVFSAVPPTATAPALIIVGALMMGPAGMMDWDNFNESFPAYLTIAVMPLTYSIANGVVAGLLCYVLIDLFSRPWWLPLYARLCGKEEGGLTKPLVSGSGGQRRASVTASPHAVCRPTTPISSSPQSDLHAGLPIRAAR